MRDAGIRAVKLRFHHADWRDDVAVVEAVRDAVGRDMEILVDANQGWRMPGDTAPRWDVATAAQCARALEPLGVYWLEEPLPTGDVEGHRALRRLTSLRIASGEMVRTAHEARDLVVRGGVDVVQTDAVLAGGIGGCRRVAALAELHGRAWSPHTWSNGWGLVANLHLALAVSTCPFVEVPYDPPALAPERRDWLLPAPVEIAADGTIAPPPGPGLGVDSRLRRPRALAGRVRIDAVVLHEPGRVSVEEVELDPPKRGEVLVRVAAAGVCHSDVMLADGRLGDGRWPMVIGHEGAGVVEAVGEDVTHVAPGRPRRLLPRARVRNVRRLPARAARISASRPARTACAGRCSTAPRASASPGTARRSSTG